MRISNLSLYNTMTNDMLDNRTEYNVRLMQVSSGKKYLNRHDDPGETSQIAGVKQDQKKNDQWQNNVETATAVTTFTDAKLDSAMTWMQRLGEIVTEANDGAASTESRKSLAGEVNQILEDMVQIGNSTYNGSYIFAGLGVDETQATQPFVTTVDANNQITAVTYYGSENLKTIQIGESAVTDVVSYGYAGGGVNGLFIATGATPPVDIFANLISLRDQLATGDIPTDATLQAAQDNLEHVIEYYTDNGVKAKRFESLVENFNQNEQVYTSQLSDMESADVAAVATELAQWQASYQASLQVTAQINKLSLLNYI